MDRFFSYLALIVGFCIVVTLLWPKLTFLYELSPRTNFLVTLVLWAVLIGAAYWGYRTGDISWWVAILISLIAPFLEVLSFFKPRPVLPVAPPPPPEPDIAQKIDELIKKNRVP